MSSSSTQSATKNPSGDLLGFWYRCRDHKQRQQNLGLLQGRLTSLSKDLDITSSKVSQARDQAITTHRQEIDRFIASSKAPHSLSLKEELSSLKQTLSGSLSEMQKVILSCMGDNSQLATERQKQQEGKLSCDELQKKILVEQHQLEIERKQLNEYQLPKNFDALTLEQVQAHIAKLEMVLSCDIGTELEKPDASKKRLREGSEDERAAKKAKTDS